MIPDVTFLLVAGDSELNRRYLTEIREEAAFGGFRSEVVLVETNRPADRWLIPHVDRFLSHRDRPWLGMAHDTAVRAGKGHYYVYFCNHHMTFVTRGWLSDLLCPLVDPKVGMTGTVKFTGFGPPSLDLYGEVPGVDYMRHVQGGIWAGRREQIRRFPSLLLYPHGYEDCVRSWSMMEAGLSLMDVPSIWSTGIHGEVCPDDSKYKLIHDYR